MFYLHLQQSGKSLYAHLEGTLDKNNTHQIEYFLVPYMKKHHITSLCCDCSKLKKVDLNGKYALLNVKMEMKKQNGSFLLCNMKKSLKASLLEFHFELMDLQKVEV